MQRAQIEDFRRGVDVRKAPFTAPLDSLRECNNAHITRGGEIEKRSRFREVSPVHEDIHGLHLLEDQLYVFGSVEDPGADLSSAVRYQRLVHPEDKSIRMERILDTESFDGKIYAIAEFEDGTIFHYYDGKRVEAWDDIAETVADKSGVAETLATKIDGIDGFSVVSDGESFTITGPSTGRSFDYNSDSSKIELTLEQEAQRDEDSTAASVELVITDGSDGGEITDLSIDGVSLLSDAVAWAGSTADTAQALVDAINDEETSPDYEAEIGDEDSTVIVRASEKGWEYNGYEVQVSASDVTVEAEEELSGGESKTQPQIVKADVVGDFDGWHIYQLSLDGRDFRLAGQAAGTGRVVLAFNNKLYSVTRSLLYFSGFASEEPPVEPDPFGWDSNETTGAGFINMTTQEAGADNLIGLGIYQDNVAVFSRSSIHLWSMDADPENNKRVQVLPNTGVIAPRTILSFGDQDLFFLAPFGIRSLRARDSSNAATAEDIGSPVDDVLVPYMFGLDSGIRERAASALDRQGRYWLAIGDRLYVLSHFPGSDVTAWSTYEVGDPITDLAFGIGRLYLRAGDVIYELQEGEYDDSRVEVRLPFLAMNDPGVRKQLLALDFGCEGDWDVYIYSSPAQPDFCQYLGRVRGTTFGFQKGLPVGELSSHFSLRLVHEGESYARLSNVVFHFNVADAG